MKNIIEIIEGRPNASAIKNEVRQRLIDFLWLAASAEDFDSPVCSEALKPRSFIRLIISRGPIFRAVSNLNEPLFVRSVTLTSVTPVKIN